MTSSSDENFHLKGWGHEVWMANCELYCGKLLVLYRNLKCSVHYHKVKEETFYLQSGLIKMRLWHGDLKALEAAAERHSPLAGCTEILMHPGDTVDIPPYTAHQFEGVAPESTIIEISTQHFEEDSYRLVRGD